MKHINIPVFVPHLGCPHDCVFCNQRKITGQESFSIETARKTVEEVVKNIDGKNEKAEIAFFGGSFTGIERSLMISLLDMANEFCESGSVSGIRLSTRPDYIDDEILSILSKYPVKTVELGIQSLSDKVLSASNRGHTAAQAISAMRAVKEAKFDLVGQMMVGLPYSTLEDEIDTIDQICKSGADGIRIYPTAVFSHTALHKMMLDGRYASLPPEEAVTRVAELLDIAYKYAVPVIRVGLCETESLHSESGIVAGAFHPALGELCMSAFFLKLFTRDLDKHRNLTGKKLIISVARNMLSKAIGQKRSNINQLKDKYSLSDIKFVTDARLAEYEFLCKIL